MFNFDVNDVRRKPNFDTGIILLLRQLAFLVNIRCSYPLFLKLNYKNIRGRYADVNRH